MVIFSNSRNDKLYIINAELDPGTLHKLFPNDAPFHEYKDSRYDRKTPTLAIVCDPYRRIEDYYYRVVASGEWKKTDLANYIPNLDRTVTLTDLVLAIGDGYRLKPQNVPLRAKIVKIEPYINQSTDDFHMSRSLWTPLARYLVNVLFVNDFVRLGYSML